MYAVRLMFASHVLLLLLLYVCFGDGIIVNIDCYLGEIKSIFRTPLHVRASRPLVCTTIAKYGDTVQREHISIIFLFNHTKSR